ncbi:MAG TPA: hypothetical protein VEI97_04535 [bacterium]|nr:hypothetical protein [bacterium]
MSQQFGRPQGFGMQRSQYGMGPGRSGGPAGAYQPPPDAAAQWNALRNSPQWGQDTGISYAGGQGPEDLTNPAFRNSPEGKARLSQGRYGGMPQTSGYHPFQQRQQPTPFQPSFSTGGEDPIPPPMQSKPFMEGQTGGLHPYQPPPHPVNRMSGNNLPEAPGVSPPGGYQPSQFSGIPEWANQNNGDTRWDSRPEAMNARTGGMHPHTPNAPQPQIPTPNLQGAPAPGAPSSWNGFNEQTFTGPSGSRQFTWDPSQSGISADGMLAQIGQLGRGNPANLNVLFKDAMGKQIGGGGMGKVGNSYLMGLKPGQQYTVEWDGAGPEGFRMGGNPRTWDQTPWIPRR